MKRIVLFGCTVGLLLMAAPVTAEAHHTASASKLTGTYWVCTTNGAKPPTHGTTRRHIHKEQPSPRHYRAHHCHKRHRASKTKTVTVIKEVQVPGPTVYVTQPCDCPTPPSPCGDNCDEPCGDDSCGHEHGHKDHGHKDHGDKHEHQKGCNKY